MKRAEKILEAAEKWKKQCLLGGGSVFTDKQLWTLKNFKELAQYFGRVSDQDEYDPNDLKAQLRPAPAETKQLFAEMLWVYCLMSPRHQDKKRDDIKKVWEWSGTELPVDHWALGDLLKEGFVEWQSPGHQPSIQFGLKKWGGGHELKEVYESSFFVHAMADWFGHSQDRRKSLLGDYDQFAEWIDKQISKQKVRDTLAVRHILAYLLFPDSCEPIWVTDHKRKIIKAYYDKWKEKPEPGVDSLIAIDKALLKVRERLEKEESNFDKDTSFYDSPFKEFWAPSNSSQRGGDKMGNGVKYKFGGCWDIYCKDNWVGCARFTGADFIVIRAKDLKEVRRETLPEAIEVAFDCGPDDCVFKDFITYSKYYEKARSSVRVLYNGEKKDFSSLYQAFNPKNPENLGLREEGHIEFRGKLKREGYKTFPPEGEPAYLFIDVPKESRWLARVSFDRDRDSFLAEICNGKSTGKTALGSTIPKALAGIGIFLDGKAPEAPESAPIEQETNTEESNTMKHPLNQILYGPPGTGKTYNTVNRALAIIEGKPLDKLEQEDREEVKQRFDELKGQGQIAMVTFHQNFAYEDFIEGIRPVLDDENEDVDENANIAYKLSTGVFRQIADRAKENKEQSERQTEAEPYNLDELLEAFAEHIDEKGPEEAIALNSGSRGYATIGEVRRKKGRFTTIVVGGIKSTPWLGRKVIERDYEAFRKGEILKYQDVKPTYKSRWTTHGSAKYYFALYQEIKKFHDQLDPESLGHVESVEPVKKQNYVLIIDEINRGNIAKIFGELITLIEPSRRIGQDDATTLTLPYSQDEFGVPDNLYLIGTMNTADRSIARLDIALRRRFEFVEMMPEPAHEGISSDINGVDCQQLLTKMNERIAFLLDREHQIGHTYFLGVQGMTALASTFQNKIIPLLQEYFYDNWEKIDLVLSSNGFLENTRTPDDLANSELVDSNRKVYKLLDFEDHRWKEPASYQAIYSNSPRQQNDADQAGQDD